MCISYTPYTFVSSKQLSGDKKLSKMNKQITFQAFDKEFKVRDLEACEPKVYALVQEYMAEKNCWPALWISDSEFSTLTEIEKASFIYHAINHPHYNNPVENFYVSMVRNGRFTKAQAIENIVKQINHHAGILSRVQHDGTFRYQTILNHRAELNRYVNDFQAVSDYKVPVS